MNDLISFWYQEVLQVAGLLRKLQVAGLYLDDAVIIVGVLLCKSRGYITHTRLLSQSKNGIATFVSANMHGVLCQL